jgi:hypothetical protein
MLHKEQGVQECDATMKNSSNKAMAQKKSKHLKVGLLFIT